MWWRVLIPLMVGVLLASGLGMLAEGGILGAYGWFIALVVSSAVGGGLAGALAPPRSSVHTPRATGEHPKPHI